jgi:hypothetical protein
MKKILAFQRKVTPHRNILVVLYFLAILLFSVSNFNTFGIFIFVVYFLISLQFDLIPDTDKLEHFYWGALYTIAIYIFYYLFQFNVYWLIAPSSFFGASKEIRDYFSPDGTPEVKDFLFTVYFAALLILSIIYG